MSQLTFGSDFDYMQDSKYYALSEAHSVWKSSYLATSTERVAAMKDLHKLGMFSLRQLAKICRVSHATAARHLEKNATGGRFTPESLTTLMVIRKIICTRQPLHDHLLRQAVEAGTSVSAIATLTGAASGSLYRQHNN